MLKLMVPLLLLLCCTEPNGAKGRRTEMNPAPPAADSVYEWVLISDTAPWRKQYNFQMFSIRDTLWTFHSDGTWFSTNGTTWTSGALNNIIGNQAFLDYVYFRNAVFGLGRLTGNIESYQFQSTIYQSHDLKKWTMLTAKSSLPERFFYHPFVFDEKIWIIGGSDKNRLYADIWNTTDGVHWVQQKTNLPFGNRSDSRIVTLRDTLYLLNQDVWMSVDGLSWQQVADAILPGVTLFGYAAVVYDDKIWLLGCNRNGQFSNEVLYSADGKTWHTQDAPWLPRGGIAATVHQDKIFMTGGKYGGTPNHPEFRYDNDIWVLQKK